MKKYILFLGLSVVLTGLFAQSSDLKLYNPEANAKAEIELAIDKASSQGKHVLIQIGGNWCRWCIAFSKKVSENDTLKSALEENYISYHLNYSNENLNEDVLKDLGYPQRFGFPVFVILDGNGKRLHTQNSVYLEEGKGHNAKKILNFFNHWSPTAIDPKSYPSKARNKS